MKGKLNTPIEKKICTTQCDVFRKILHCQQSIRHYKTKCTTLLQKRIAKRINFRSLKNLGIKKHWGFMERLKSNRSQKNHVLYRTVMSSTSSALSSWNGDHSIAGEKTHNRSISKIWQICCISISPSELKHQVATIKIWRSQQLRPTEICLWKSFPAQSEWKEDHSIQQISHYTALISQCSTKISNIKLPRCGKASKFLWFMKQLYSPREKKFLNAKLGLTENFKGPKGYEQHINERTEPFNKIIRCTMKLLHLKCLNAIKHHWNLKIAKKEGAKRNEALHERI